MDGPITGAKIVFPIVAPLASTALATILTLRDRLAEGEKSAVERVASRQFGDTAPESAPRHLERNPVRGQLQPRGGWGLARW